MRIWFCKTGDIGGWLIRLLTFSQWNHVAIEIDGVVYDAMAGKGVRLISAWGFEHRWDKAIPVSVPVKDKQAALDFLNEQIGKGYDWGGIIAFPFRKSWHDDGKWFCSELAAEALNLGSHYSISRVASSRITPRDLWVRLP